MPIMAKQTYLDVLINLGVVFHLVDLQVALHLDHLLVAKHILMTEAV